MKCGNEIIRRVFMHNIYLSKQVKTYESCNSNSFASFKLEVDGELVDPFIEFWFGKLLIITCFSIGGFLYPGPVFSSNLFVFGSGESMEGADEFSFVNLTVSVCVNSVEHGFGFSVIDAVFFNLDGRDDSDGGDEYEFHL